MFFNRPTMFKKIKVDRVTFCMTPDKGWYTLVEFEGEQIVNSANYLT